ncbi:MAG: sensor histidine kinase [Sandaracinaceae bacterium]
MISDDPVLRRTARDACMATGTLSRIDVSESCEEALARVDTGSYGVVLIGMSDHADARRLLGEIARSSEASWSVLIASRIDGEGLRAASVPGTSAPATSAPATSGPATSETGIGERIATCAPTRLELERAVRNAVYTRRLERELERARGASERQLEMLGSIAEVVARIHRSATAEEAVATTVRATSIMLGAAVSLDLTFAERAFHGAHDPFEGRPGRRPFSLVVPLAALHGEAAGELRCERDAEAFEPAEHIAAAQLARGSAVAIEKHALLSVAQSHLREREEIVTVVSHDLRAPVQNFLFGLAALRHAPMHECGPTLDRLNRTAEQMGLLIDDLLDVSRVHDGGLVVRKSSIPSGRVLRDVVDQSGALADDRHIVLTSDISRNAPPVVADERRLRQAIDNLVGNALRHARTRVTLRVSSVPDGVRFHVVDDGPGVPSEVRSRLFERLYQGPNGARGTLGLGLYIVNGIAKAHGGHAGVSDAPGGGSDFWIEIPNARA